MDKAIGLFLGVHTFWPTVIRDVPLMALNARDSISIFLGGLLQFPM